MTDFPQPFPDVRRALLADPGPQPWQSADPAEQLTIIEKVRAEARAAALAETREDVAEVTDVDAGGVPCRVYRPAGSADGRDATIVHAHGGGFVFNDVDVHDASCRRLANRSGMVVVSVDYRRPPEHRFPAAPDDLDAVVGWLPGSGLPAPYVVHGDSAGANLALVAALRHPGFFAAAGLIYPFLDPHAGFASYDVPRDLSGFRREEAAWYWHQYAALNADGQPDLEHPDLAPLRSDKLGSLPPTLVVTAELDPLCDEGEELARRAAEAGAPVVATRYVGQVHGIWRHPGVFVAGQPLMTQVVGFLRQYV